MGLFVAFYSTKCLISTQTFIPMCIVRFLQTHAFQQLLLIKCICGILFHQCLNFTKPTFQSILSVSCRPMHFNLVRYYLYNGFKVIIIFKLWTIIINQMNGFVCGILFYQMLNLYTNVHSNVYCPLPADPCISTIIIN